MLKLCFVISLFMFVFYSACGLASSTQITVCYEDKEVPPFYLESGSEVPSENPGANIEVLQHIQANMDAKVEFRFIRRPWVRCWDLIKKGDADALISSYRPEREAHARFPKKAGQLDTSRTLNHLSNCLYGDDDFHAFWQKRHIFQSQGKAVAVQNGYAIEQKLAQEPVFIHSVFSKQDALKLLANKRVHAVVDVCKVHDQTVNGVAGQNNQITPIFPPIHHYYGYLVFAPAFYNVYPQVVESVWDQLAQEDYSAFYIKALALPAMTSHSP